MIREILVKQSSIPMAPGMNDGTIDSGGQRGRVGAKKKNLCAQTMETAA